MRYDGKEVDWNQNIIRLTKKRVFYQPGTNFDGIGIITMFDMKKRALRKVVTKTLAWINYYAIPFRGNRNQFLLELNV